MNIGERWVNALAGKALTDEQRALDESGPKNLGRLASAKRREAAGPPGKGYVPRPDQEGCSPLA